AGSSPCPPIGRLSARHELEATIRGGPSSRRFTALSPPTKRNIAAVTSTSSMRVDNLRASWRWLTAPYAALDAERARRGPTFWIDLALVGRALVTGDPALVREIASRRDLEAGPGVS